MWVFHLVCRSDTSLSHLLIEVPVESEGSWSHPVPCTLYVKCGGAESVSLTFNYLALHSVERSPRASE